ncbi:MAG: hypothetical protein IPJ49_21955, partial [Candidatus Obscuribacter sp.]|nr:hypothetical protein [Candidatus Obscuribacter sp.]
TSTLRYFKMGADFKAQLPDAKPPTEGKGMPKSIRVWMQIIASHGAFNHGSKT